MRPIWTFLLAVTLVACASTDDEEIVQPAVAVRAVAPVYPPVARRYGVQGSVRVRIRVLADGSAGELRVWDSSGSVDLDAAALEAARQSEYRAARSKSGKSVASWIVAPYTFRLE